MQAKQTNMKKSIFLWMGILFILMAGVSSCSSDDDVISNSKLIVGEWEASHQSKNPKYFDTADEWDFTFNADGTGSWPLATGSFRYHIEGNRITLRLMNTETYYGQTEFEYIIVSLSKDRMEWDEIPVNGSDNSLYPKFSRKKQ